MSLILLLSAGLGASVIWTFVRQQLKVPFELTQSFLAKELSSQLDATGTLPSEIELPVYKNFDPNLEPLSSRDPHLNLRQRAFLNTTLEENYGRTLRTYLERYRPDYGSIVVLNPDTGAILALESFVKNSSENLGHLALKAYFPAASVFKIITAAAAIDQGKAAPETVISYNGRNHTLYRKNINDQSVNRWTQHVTLREAFGKSINSVFGKLGLFHVGSDDLNHYAKAFHFNQKFKSELQIEKSSFVMDPSNFWQLVETSAGFTDRTTLSPLHGALIASAILNGGSMPAPYAVNSVVTSDGKTLYENSPKVLRTVMNKNSALKMQTLMEETITNGTSRKNFRGLTGSDFQIGGKTGSLDGHALTGRTDWFVGYASHDDLRLAIGVVTVHKKFWTVKSSMLARMFFQDVFQDRERHSQRKIRDERQLIKAQNR